MDAFPTPIAHPLHDLALAHRLRKIKLNPNFSFFLTVQQLVQNINPPPRLPMDHNGVPTTGTTQETIEGEASMRLLPHQEDTMRWRRSMRELRSNRSAMHLLDRTEEEGTERSADWESNEYIQKEKGTYPEWEYSAKSTTTDRPSSC